MALLIGILTFIMVVVCLILILLVLIQLPKKDAGAGVAFGGAATDALFGAGSGNVLTKTTKYMAGAFFVLAIVLALMQSSYFRRNETEFRKGVKEQSSSQPATTTADITPAPVVTPAAAPTPATTTPAAAAPSNTAPAK